MFNKFIICKKCGIKVEINNMQSKKLYCDSCAYEIQKEYARKNSKKYYKTRKTKKPKKLCSTGCGRPVGKGLTFLCNICYKNSNQELEYETPGKNAFY